MITKGGHTPAAAGLTIDEGPRATDIYGRYKYIQRMSRSAQGKLDTKHFYGSRRIKTQNVRDFRDKSRGRWLNAWRRTPVVHLPLAWIIQEAHVCSQSEVEELTSAWARLWGQLPRPDSPVLSYWSVSDTRAVGVAILLLLWQSQRPLGVCLAGPTELLQWT